MFYITFIGFNLDSIHTLRMELGARSRFYIYGIPTRDIVLFIIFGVLICNYKKIFSLIKLEYIGLLILVVLIFSIQGLLLNGFSSIPLIRADLRSLLWFIGGIGFCFVLIKSGNVTIHLKVMVGLSAILIIISSLYTLEVVFLTGKDLNDLSRISDENMYLLSAFVFSPLILLFNIEDNSLKRRIFHIVIMGAMMFCLVYLTVTRTMAITLFMVIILFYLSLFFERDKAFIRYKRRKGMYIIPIIIFVMGIAFIQNVLSEDSRLSRLSDISLSSAREDSRYDEMIEFLEQSYKDSSIIMGQGLGGTIKSSVYDGAETGTMHVGILNLWMKMGLILFISVSIFLFVIIPYWYGSTLFKSESMVPFRRTANLIVIPLLFPWLLGLALSGGFTEVGFLFAGFTYLLYGELRRYGLSRLIIT